MSGDHDQKPAGAEARPSAREAALRIARELRERGYQALFAGGSVRDRLLGLEAKDYDVTTDARPEEVRRIFQKTHDVGASFGVILVRLMGHTVEVTTFRKEGPYGDRRHPDSIEFADAAQDAKRRDFTINGLFEDPLTGEIVDYVGGQNDLREGIIRAIGNPTDRLSEDHLRALRAVRFAARFGFQIERRTAQAITASATALRGISRERIGQEVEWMLSHPSRAAAAWMIQDFGLDAAVLEEPHRDAALECLAGVAPDAAYPTALAAWWLDRWRFEPASSRPDPRRWRPALMLSNDASRDFLDTLAVVERLLTEWEELPVARRKRLASLRHYQAGLSLVKTIDADRAAHIANEVDELVGTGLVPTPLVDGQALIEMGLEPGPAFGTILEQVYDAQLEGRVKSHEEALALAADLARDLAGA